LTVVWRKQILSVEKKAEINAMALDAQNANLDAVSDVSRRFVAVDRVISDVLSDGVTIRTCYEAVDVQMSLAYEVLREQAEALRELARL